MAASMTIWRPRLAPYLAMLMALCLGLARAPAAAAAPTKPANLQEYAQQVAQNVRVTWSHADRIWKGADYMQLMLVLTDVKEAWAITADATHELTPEERANLPMPRLSGSVNYQPFDDFQGHRGLTISVPRNYFGTTWDQFEPQYLSTFAFHVASHELFHFQVQDLAHGGWSLPVGDHPASRGTLYPLEIAPRVARLELFDTLLHAYAEPARRAEHLGAAAYWYNVWASESGEAGEQSMTDLTEGTAEYFAVVAGARAALGFDALAETYRRTLIGELEKRRDQQWIPQLDLESYHIGVAAGLLAEEQGLDWQADAARGTAPVTFLLQNVPPVAQEPTPRTVARISSAVADENAQVAPHLDPLIDALADPSHAVLALPATGMVGTFAPGQGFYHAEDMPDLQLMPSVSARFELPAGGVNVNRRAAAFGDAPCPLDPPPPADVGQAQRAALSAFLLVPLGPEEIEDATSDLTITSGTLITRVHVNRVQDDTGRPVYCAVAPET